MDMKFSEKAEQLDAGIFAVLNEKKNENRKAGDGNELQSVRRHTGFSADAAYHGGGQRGGKAPGELQIRALRASGAA